MKTCEDCAWAAPDSFSDEAKQWNYAKCKHPKINNSARVSLKADSDVYCSTARMFIVGLCGKRGKYWEPKD